MKKTLLLFVFIIFQLTVLKVFSMDIQDHKVVIVQVSQNLQMEIVGGDKYLTISYRNTGLTNIKINDVLLDKKYVCWAIAFMQSPSGETFSFSGVKASAMIETSGFPMGKGIILFAGKSIDVAIDWRTPYEKLVNEGRWNNGDTDQAHSNPRQVKFEILISNGSLFLRDAYSKNATLTVSFYLDSKGDIALFYNP